MGDSLALFCQKADATVRLQPGKKNPSMPQVSLSLSADTMFCRAWKRKMGGGSGQALAVDRVKIA